jgi:hypothetical protein
MNLRPFLVLAIVLGCGGLARVPDKALDEGKLDKETSAQLGAARQELERSRVAVERAKDQVVYARQEDQLAETDQQRVQVEYERAKKAFEDAKLRREAADARRAYTDALVDARVAAEDSARSRVDVADAKLEHLKVVAIQQVDAKAGEQYRRSEYDERVAEAQRKADAVERKARDREQDARERQGRWEELARKAPTRNEG